MKNDFTETLEAAGLSETEAIIYTTLLGSARMTLSEIARTSGVKRATCYQYIDLLLSKDFVVRVPIKKRMFYSAANPKKILAIAKKKYATLEAAVAEMSKQHDRSTNKPKVLFYEGKREIKHIYEDLFQTVGDAYSIFPPSAFFENFTEQEYNEFDAAITQHAFKSKDLIIGDQYFKRIRSIREGHPSADKLTKKLPESFKSNVDVLIHNDKVALISLHDLSALIIESKDIAELFKSMHSSIWKSL